MTFLLNRRKTDRIMYIYPLRILCIPVNMFYKVPVHVHCKVQKCVNLKIFRQVTIVCDYKHALLYYSKER